LKKSNCSPFATTSIRNSSFEIKDEEQATSTSLFNIKKAIKSSGVDSEEGFTCIKIECPICDFDKKPAKDQTKKDIYVNKTTGNLALIHESHSLYSNMSL
jgi:hypothetical protein